MPESYRSHHAGGGLGDGLPKSLLKCGSGMGYTFFKKKSTKIVEVHCGYFAAARIVMFGHGVSETLEGIEAILLVSTWTLLVLRIVVQEAVRCIFSFFVNA